MANDYLEGATRLLLEHNKWDKYAEEYEISLSRALYNDPTVIQAAQKALYKMSRVLTGYYGTGQTALPTSVEEMETIVGNSQAMVEAAGGNSVEDVQAGRAERLPQPEEDALDGSASGEAVQNGPVEITPTMMSIFLKQEAESAGQVGKGSLGEQDRENLDAVINKDGNLREKMTAMYNAALLNSRDGHASLKNMAREIPDNKARELGVDLDAIKQDRSMFGMDIMDVGNIAIGSTKWYRHPGRLLSFIFGNKARRRLEATERKTLGRQFYEQNSMPLSPREQRLATTVGDDGKSKLLWQEGVFYSGVKADSSWTKSRRKRGFRLLTGPSGTTARMLRAYKWLGATQDELIAFRLALAGWMLAGDHSLYEIITGAKQAGVRGKEDTTNAITLYKTLDPLPLGYLRSRVAVERQFPDEHVFREYTLDNIAQNSRLGISREAAGKKGASEHAVFAYSSQLYQAMNPGIKSGTEAALKHTAINKLEHRHAQLSSKILIDSMPYMKKETGRTVYRATSVPAFMSKFSRRGAKFTTDTFTSTSKIPYVPVSGFYTEKTGAAGFFSKPILMEIELRGHGGVDIEKIASIPGEQEITLMKGTELRVDKTIHTVNYDAQRATTFDGMDGLHLGMQTKRLTSVNMVHLTEVGNKYNRYNPTTPEEALEADMADPLSIRNPNTIVPGPTAPVLGGSTLPQLNTPLLTDEHVPDAETQRLLSGISALPQEDVRPVTEEILGEFSVALYGVMVNDLESEMLHLPEGAFLSEQKLSDALAYVLQQKYGDPLLSASLTIGGPGYSALRSIVRSVLVYGKYAAELDAAYQAGKKATPA